MIKNNHKAFDEYIGKRLQDYQILQDKMVKGDVSGYKNMGDLAKELSSLSKILPDMEKYLGMIKSLQGCDEMLGDKNLHDDMRIMAEQEKKDLDISLPILRHELELKTIPSDGDDKINALIVEVRAGTGGLEAALFAGDLLSMYRCYAEKNGWRFETIAISENDLGGVATGSASIKGDGIYDRMKFEGGVHRVQRVPITENAGRVHTSTATVAILPEPEDVEIILSPEDLRIDTYRSQGAGGQHVNTTDSAVRITHIPSGVAVACQSEKSQHKNRAQAMRLLRARLFEYQREEKIKARIAARRLMVGSGERAEKIRTYNFPEGRVSDHRIKLTLYKLTEIMNGSALDEVIEPLIKTDKEYRLSNFLIQLEKQSK
ncbi:MAG: peptide chain release factor 1 [Alphaproteobacteria bacterium]